MGLFTSDKIETRRCKKLKEQDCFVTFSIEIPPSEVENETQNLLVRIQQRARIAGFRPGKAPLDLVKKQFSGHAREEVVESLIRKHVPEALRELKIRPVAAPAVEDVSWEPGKPLKLQVKVEVPPAVSPRDYTKIAVKRKTYAVADEAVAQRVQELREANARLERASEDAVAEGHYVVIDYEGFQGGKPLPNAKGQSELVDMSSEQTVEGLVEGLLGMKRDEAKEISVKLGGKDASLKVTVKEVKRKILPELDAEFAKDLGFESVDQLKAKLREVMEDEAKTKTEREVTQQIEEALLKANKIPLPPSLVQAQLEHMLERLKRSLQSGQLSDKQLDELRAKLQPRAEDEVRISYLLPAIAEKERIAVLDEELKLELERNLAGLETEEKKGEVSKLFEERREAIAGMIRDRKTMAFIREKAVITDVQA